MHLLAGRAVARAHGATPLLAALADPHAAPGRLGEAELVLGVREMGVGLGRPVGGAEAEGLIEAVRPDDLPGVHLPIGIEDRLELFEGADELFAVHDGQKLRLALPVAVLAGERAAVPRDEPSGLFHEGAIPGDALRVRQAELDAR